MQTPELVALSSSSPHSPAAEPTLQEIRALMFPFHCDQVPFSDGFALITSPQPVLAQTHCYFAFVSVSVQEVFSPFCAAEQAQEIALLLSSPCPGQGTPQALLDTSPGRNFSSLPLLFSFAAPSLPVRAFRCRNWKKNGISKEHNPETLSLP